MSQNDVTKKDKLRLDIFLNIKSALFLSHSSLSYFSFPDASKATDTMLHFNILSRQHLSSHSGHPLTPETEPNEKDTAC